MVEEKVNKKQKSLEEILWDSANKLRGSVEPSEYKIRRKMIENDYSLITSRYIKFVDRDSGIDFDKEMKRIQQDFKAILADEVEPQMALKNAFKGLGYEI